VAEENWETIKEYPEPSPKTPGKFKKDVLFQSTMVTVITALMVVMVAQPVSQETDQYIFEEMPGCQAQVDDSRFSVEATSYCFEQIEFCYNNSGCDLSISRHDRYNDYFAKLPDRISNSSFRYRLRKDLDSQLSFRPFRCERCYAA
jgi:hypothetical protein